MKTKLTAIILSGMLTFSASSAHADSAGNWQGEAEYWLCEVFTLSIYNCPRPQR